MLTSRSLNREFVFQSINITPAKTGLLKIGLSRVFVIVFCLHFFFSLKGKSFLGVTGTKTDRQKHLGTPKVFIVIGEKYTRSNEKGDFLSVFIVSVS